MQVHPRSPQHAVAERLLDAAGVLGVLGVRGVGYWEAGSGGSGDGVWSFGSGRNVHADDGGGGGAVVFLPVGLGDFVHGDGCLIGFG